MEQGLCRATDPAYDEIGNSLLDRSEKKRNEENVIVDVLQMENCFRPRVQDEGEDIFESVGTSSTTICTMSGSNLPKTGMFYADCVRNEIYI